MADGFDMFDEAMDEELDATQLPEGVSQARAESEDTDNDELEDDGLSVVQRCDRILDQYFDNSVVERHDNFYDECDLTQRGRKNLDDNWSAFMPKTSGSQLVSRAGVSLSTKDAKSLTTRLVDTSVEALVNRAVVVMALDQRRTISTADVHGANLLVGKRLV